MTTHKKCQMPDCKKTINSLNPRMILANNNLAKDKFGNWSHEKKWDRKAGNGADHRTVLTRKHKNLKVCESCYLLLEAIEEKYNDNDMDHFKSVKIIKTPKPIDSFIHN
jgi:hypothetical protein